MCKQEIYQAQHQDLLLRILYKFVLYFLNNIVFSMHFLSLYEFLGF
jgi:hypothetical protein